MGAAHLVIYNPTAGRGRARKRWAQVEQALRQAGVRFDVTATRAPQEAIQIAQAAASQYRAVVCAGGDGTAHEIANGLLRASGEAPTIPLGIIPLGTGDDFAKMLPPGTPIGGSAPGWAAAVEKIARGERHSFDVLRVQGDGRRPGLESGSASPHYALNSLSVGFSAQAAYHLKRTPQYIQGFAAYLAAVLQTLRRYPVVRARFDLDGERWFEQASTITAAMNGRCLGNGFWIAPEARTDDGFLELVVAQEIDRRTILRMIPKLMRGTHIHEPVVDFYRHRRVVIAAEAPQVVEVDGETPFLSARRLEIAVLPGRLTVIA